MLYVPREGNKSDETGLPPGLSLQYLADRIARIEDRFISFECRLKTVERNAPLEVRLREVEKLMKLGTSAQGVAGSWPSSFCNAMVGLAVGFSTLLCASLPTAVRKMAIATVQTDGQKEDATEFPTRSAILQEKTRLARVAHTSAPPPEKVVATPELQSETDVVAADAVADDGCAIDAPERECILDDQIQTVSLSAADLEGGGVGLDGQALIRSLHREARARGLDTYVDPATGFDVWTSDFLRSRPCCGSGCRHCPWGHRNVPTTRSKRTGAPKSTLYTRKGDAGWTNLYNEMWILKSEPVYEAIGDVDELNSALGLARSFVPDGDALADLAQQLEALQGWLLDVGSALCTPRDTTLHPRKLQKTRGVTEETVAEVEAWIDEADVGLRKLRNFILPGGSSGSGALQLARCICRRAERHLWPLIKKGQADELLGIFLNRLSDYLFVVARLEAHANGADEQQYGVEFKVDRVQRQIKSAA